MGSSPSSPFEMKIRPLYEEKRLMETLNFKKTRPALFSRGASENLAHRRRGHLSLSPNHPSPRALRVNTANRNHPRVGPPGTMTGRGGPNRNHPRVGPPGTMTGRGGPGNVTIGSCVGTMNDISEEKRARGGGGQCG